MYSRKEKEGRGGGGQKVENPFSCVRDFASLSMNVGVEERGGGDVGLLLIVALCVKRWVRAITFFPGPPSPTCGIPR